MKRHSPPHRDRIPPWLPAGVLAAGFLPASPAAAAPSFAAANGLGLPWLAVALLLLIPLLLIPFLLWHCRRLKKSLLATAHQLDLSRLRYRQILDNAGDALFIIRPSDGRLQEINQAAEQLLGYSAGEIRALALPDLLAAPHRRRYLRLVKKVLAEGYGEEGGLIFCCKSGRQFTAAVHARRGKLGDEELVHAVVRDVSDIKQTEQELRKKNLRLTMVNRIARSAAGSLDLKEMLSTVLDEIVDSLEADGGGIYLLRHEGSVLDLVCHRQVEEYILNDLRRLTPGQGLAGRVATSGQPRSATEVHSDSRLQSEAVRKAGWGGFQAVPLTAKDRTVGVLFIFNRCRRLFNREEVSLLLAIGRQAGTSVAGAELFEALSWQHRLTRASNRELERSRGRLRRQMVELEEANRILERVERMKNQFLALASHELRTPLTYVLSGTEHLLEQLEGRLEGGEYRTLEAIYQGGGRLNDIVSNLLEVARLESQSIYLAREEIDLGGLFEQLGNQFRPVAGERRLSLQVHPPAIPLPLQGDPHHLHKTFARLLENAIKFTPDGGSIAVSARARSTEEIFALAPALQTFSPAFFSSRPTGPFLQVTVADTGIGIADEEKSLIFGKFYETGDIASHSTSSSRFGGKGVGLGLTLVKGVVEAHGGMIWVDGNGTGRTEHGRTEHGSAFHVLLPMVKPQGERTDDHNESLSGDTTAAAPH